jgi:hypothetical protein
MLTHRVILSDNGVLTDYSLQGAAFVTALVAAEDYIYIGQQYPFNSLHVQSSVANTASATISVEFWNGGAWTACVDVLDETSSGGKTLAQSGVIRFNTKRNDTWQVVQDTSSDPMDSLSTLYIFNNYWIRIKASASLSETTAISKVGYCLTDDATLSSLDADINEYLTSWATGKASWMDQMVLASQHVVIDLKNKNLIQSQAQIVQINEDVKLLTAYRTLLLIYPNLGEKYGPRRDFIEKQYVSLLASIKPYIDTNNNAKLDYKENEWTQNRTTR